MNLTKENALWLKQIICSYVINMKRLKELYVDSEKIALCDYSIRRSNDILDDLDDYIERLV